MRARIASHERPVTDQHLLATGIGCGGNATVTRLAPLSAASRAARLALRPIAPARTFGFLLGRRAVRCFVAAHNLTGTLRLGAEEHSSKPLDAGGLGLNHPHQRPIRKKGLRQNLWVNRERFGELELGFFEGWQGK
jgi:hypothetical protein